MGYLEELEAKAAIKIAKDNLDTKSRKPLVKKEAFKDSCRSLLVKKLDTFVLALHLMLYTGRRLADLKRILASNVVKTEATCYMVNLNRDKTHQQSAVSFKVDFSTGPPGWSIFEVSELTARFDQALNQDDFPFSRLPSNAARVARFRPHSIRAIFAIWLTLEGYDDTTIMRRVGWSSKESLVRYRRLSGEDISGLGSLERVLQAIDGY